MEQTSQTPALFAPATSIAFRLLGRARRFTRCSAKLGRALRRPQSHRELPSPSISTSKGRGVASNAGSSARPYWSVRERDMLLGGRRSLRTSRTTGLHCGGSYGKRLCGPKQCNHRPFRTSALRRERRGNCSRSGA